MNEAVEHKADIVKHHPLGFLSHLKRVRVPAPVAVKKYAVAEPALQASAHGGFSDTHRPADKINHFHIIGSVKGNLAAYRLLALCKPLGYDSLGALVRFSRFGGRGGIKRVF